MVSNASEDFPEPETPVTTVMVLCGISKSIFLRLWTRAPRTMMLSVDITRDRHSVGKGNAIQKTHQTLRNCLIISETTKDAQTEQWAAFAAHLQIAYRCARFCSWGVLEEEFAAAAVGLSAVLSVSPLSAGRSLALYFEVLT